VTALRRAFPVHAGRSLRGPLEWLSPVAARRIGLTLASLAAFVLVWTLLSGHVINAHLLPSPGAVLRTAVPMAETGELARHVLASLRRIALGFMAGSVVGALIGVWMARLRSFGDLLDPVVQLFRFLSPTAMIPIAVIWFGIGETSKYFLIFYATVFIVLINTFAGVLRTPALRIRAAQSMGAGEIAIFLLVIVPSTVPYILAGMRIALASAFMAIIPAEMLAADSGLGFLLQQSGLLVQTNRIFVALAVISALGFLADLTFRVLTSWLFSRYTGISP
jgi:NitT/TauT family transport system permease protein/taurine transport system permease protein